MSTALFLSRHGDQLSTTVRNTVVSNATYGRLSGIGTGSPTPCSSRRLMMFG